jgi:hypothetical protein
VKPGFLPLDDPQREIGLGPSRFLPLPKSIRIVRAIKWPKLMRWECGYWIRSDSGGCKDEGCLSVLKTRSHPRMTGVGRQRDWGPAVVGAFE